MPSMNLRDLNYFHLRRLNQNKSGHDGKDNLILLVEHTKFGRNPDMVDVVLTSAVYSNMISRNHAEIVGKKNANGRFEKYTISDSSLNGTYINDQRISNQPQELKEGDVIKFGHMNGAAVKAGQVAPQANAEFAFLVERAQAAHNYLGCDANGRRTRTLSCKGDVDLLTEITPGTHTEATRATQPVGQTIPSTTTQPTSSVPAISNSLPWAAGQFYGTPSTPGTFQFPQALQFLGFNNATNPATANQFMSMLGARNQQLDPQWAAAMGLQMQPRLATAAQLQQAAQQAAFAGNPYQTPPSTSASFLPPAALDNRLASSANATQQANLAFNMQHNSALVNSLLQQQQQQQFAQAQQGTPQPTSVVQQTGQPHPVVQNPPQIKTEPPTPTLPTVPTAAIKPQVGSPPMECDSSVPSPPKVTATPTTAQQTAVAPRAASPRQTSSDQDQRSEKSWSMVDSPPMPRAPAPSHANRELSRTPSPKSDTPEAEKEAAREKEERERREREEKEKEKEEREKERKRKDDEEERRRKEREREQREARERLKAAEAKAKANKGSRKGSEIARLINDLEGSFMTSARGSDLREQRKSLDGRKDEKDYKEEKEPSRREKEKEKEREKEKEKEKPKEKERPKQTGRAKSDKSSTAASTPSEKSVKTEVPTKQQNKLLKQLSDVSSVSSSSDSEAEKKKKKSLTSSSKKPSSSSQPKKEAPKRRPSTPASNSSDSDSDTDSLSSLDETHVRGKPSSAKKPRRNSAPKTSNFSSKPKMPPLPPKKRGRKPKSQDSSSSEESPEPEPMYPPPDPNVVFHDPIETCAMEKECNRPQTQNVNWVACDDCEKWYHAICILGKEDITGLDDFTCGCKEKKAKKKKIK